MFAVFVSSTFRKQFKRLPEDKKERIRKGLDELEKDPFNTRPGADIKPLADTDPRKHRLRVGDHRVVYRVKEKEVRVIELFRRGRGYRK